MKNLMNLMTLMGATQFLSMTDDHLRGAGEAENYSGAFTESQSTPI